MTRGLWATILLALEDPAASDDDVDISCPRGVAALAAANTQRTETLAKLRDVAPDPTEKLVAAEKVATAMLRLALSAAPAEVGRWIRTSAATGEGDEEVEGAVGRAAPEYWTRFEEAANARLSAVEELRKAAPGLEMSYRIALVTCGELVRALFKQQPDWAERVLEQPWSRRPADQ